MTIKAKPIWELEDYQGNMPNNQDIMPIIDVDGDATNEDSPEKVTDFSHAVTRKMTVSEIKDWMTYMTGKAAGRVFRTLFESITGYKSNPNEYTVKTGEDETVPTELATMLNLAYNYLMNNHIADFDKMYTDIAQGNFGDKDWDDYVYTDSETSFFSKCQAAAAQGILDLGTETDPGMFKWLNLLLYFAGFLGNKDDLRLSFDAQGNATVSSRNPQLPCYFYGIGTDPDTVGVVDFGVKGEEYPKRNFHHVAHYDPSKDDDTPSDTEPTRAPVVTYTYGWTGGSVGEIFFQPGDTSDGSVPVDKLNQVRWTGDMLNPTKFGDQIRYFRNPTDDYVDTYKTYMVKTFRNNTITDERNVALSGISLPYSGPLFPNVIKLAFGAYESITADSYYTTFYAPLTGTREEVDPSRECGWTEFSKRIMPDEELQSIRMNIPSSDATSRLADLAKFVNGSNDVKWLPVTIVNQLAEASLNLTCLNGYTREQEGGMDTSYQCTEIKKVEGSGDWKFLFAKNSTDTAAEISTFCDFSNPTMSSRAFVLAKFTKTEAEDRWVDYNQVSTVAEAWASEEYAPEMYGGEAKRYEFQTVTQMAAPGMQFEYMPQDGSMSTVSFEAASVFYTNATTTVGLAAEITPVDAAPDFTPESKDMLNRKTACILSWKGWDPYFSTTFLGRDFVKGNLTWTHNETTGRWGATFHYASQAEAYFTTSGAVDVFEKAKADHLILCNEGATFEITPYIYGKNKNSLVLSRESWSDYIKSLTVHDFAEGIISTIRKFLPEK